MLSIVIATLNRPARLRDAVTDALAQLPDDGEIAVVDQSDAPRLTVDDPRLRHLVIGERGLPNARNVGVQATSRPIVLFVDDDVRLRPGCIAAHLAAYDDPRVGGAVGRIIEASVRPNSAVVANRLSVGGRVITNLDGDERVQVDVLKGANMSFRRRALDQVGGFDRNYLGTALLEDADVSTRVRAAGWQLWYLPDAVLEHLSEQVGGVRVDGAKQTERWRFHNTAYFMRRHRGRRDAAVSLATFAAIAARRALQWRDPAAPAMLLDAWMQGRRRADGPPDTE